MCVVNVSLFIKKKLRTVLQHLLPAVRVYCAGCLRDCLRWTDMDADRPEKRPGQLEGEDPYE